MSAAKAAGSVALFDLNSDDEATVEYVTEM
jgi:hypothetical protein